MLTTQSEEHQDGSHTHARVSRRWSWARAGAWTRPGWPTVAHVVTLVVAFAFWLHEDRNLSFFGDEWQFLTARGVHLGLRNPQGLWFPHNEHWSTVPILIWRAIYNVVHLTSYLPYLLPVLVAHLCVMHLAWRRCLREGVDPWIATGLVAVLGVLGAGSEDLAWGFQIGFVGSVAFGLLALDLADRAEPSLLLDGLASVATLLALMCSTIGDATTVALAVVLVARAPWRRFVRVLALPVGGYLLWWLAVGRLGLKASSDHLTATVIGDLPNYVLTGASSALGAIFNLPDAGAALVVGLVAWLTWQARALWRGHPAILGLAGAVVVFYTLAALGRDSGPTGVTVSRYVYVAAALLTPVLGRLVGSGVAVLRGGRLIVLGLLALTAVGNIGQAHAWVGARVAMISGLQPQIAGAARLLGAGAPTLVQQPLSLDPDLNVTVLQRLDRQHLLPHLTLTTAQLLDARTALETTVGPSAPVPGNFRVVWSALASVTSPSPGCKTFTPTVASPPMQVDLDATSANGAASTQVTSPATPPGTPDYLAAFLAPAHGPAAPQPVELALPATGHAYFGADAPGYSVILAWNVDAPLTLCGLQATSPGP